MSGLGLLSWQSNDAYVAEQDAAKQQERERQSMLQMETALAGHIRTCWESAKTAKRDVEERLLDCMRRVKGEYSADKLQAIQKSGGSAIYMMLTATKVRAAESWVRDILIPTSEKPWGLEPTPVSDIPAPYMQQINAQVMQQAQAMQQQGQPVDPAMIQQMQEQAVEQIRTQVQEKAAEAADRMEKLIEDQLAEGLWLESLESFIYDFAAFPAAIIKGPLLRKRKTLQWAEGWQPVKADEIRPEFQHVSPFDLYPSPDSTDIDDGAYIIERTRYTRAQLNSLIGVAGYDEQSLRDVLREYGQGGLRDWLWSDTERARLEGRKHDLISPADTIDGLHYYGSAQGTQLLQFGMSPETITDPLAEYQVEAILIGRHCIRCVINDDPMERRPFGKASFQPVPGSFWGIAIPELMADIQDVCNATARALINNLSISSGPQVDVSMDRLAPGENPADIYPWKIWRTKSDRVAGGGNNPAVRFFQPGSNSAELLNTYNTFEQKADDATNIPRYLYGNERAGGAGNTASGLSMLMESANKGIKAAIGHIDSGVIRRMIEALWLHNMQYHPDSSVKGDCKAVPRGSSAMLQRERTQMLRQQLFQQLVNPEIAQQAMGVKGQIELLRSVTDGVGISGLVPDGIEDVIEQQSQQPSPEQQLAQQELQAKVQKLQAEAQKISAAAAKDSAETESKLPAEVQKLLAEIQKLTKEAQHAGRSDAPPPRPRAEQAQAAGGYGAQQLPGMAGAGGMAGQPQRRMPGLSGENLRPAGDQPQPGGAQADPGSGQRY